MTETLDMQVRHIYHSGFLLETGKSYYLFDYYRGELPQLDADKPIVVFGSHGHRDHYNPEVFSLLRAMGMKDVFAVLAEDIAEKKYPDDVDVLKACVNKTYDLPHGERLETLRSTDSGVAFVLAFGAGTVYHAGDLNDWTWEGEPDDDNNRMRENYRREIDKLSDRRIDVAFVPLDPRQEAHYADGMLYFLSAVDAKRVYPMHYWKKSGVIERFLTEHPQYRDIVQHLGKSSGGIGA